VLLRPWIVRVDVSSALSMYFSCNTESIGLSFEASIDSVVSFS